MDLSVAVDKLNSMTTAEIITEAIALPVCHVPHNNEECLIANLLRYWGVPEKLRVFRDSAVRYDPSTEVPGNAKERVVLPSHVRKIIYYFDENWYKTLGGL